MGYRLRMSDEIHDWLADLRDDDPGAARRVGQALIALMGEGPGLGPPLVADLASPGPAGGPEVPGEDDPERVEQMQAARRQLAEAATLVQDTQRQITELEAAEARLGDLRWRALGEGQPEAAAQAVDELAGVQGRLAELRRALPGRIEAERRLRQQSPGLPPAAGPGADAGPGDAPRGSAQTPDDELTARLAEIAAEIERELHPKAPREGLMELSPGARGDSDVRILFAVEPPGTALLIAVLEGHAAVQERRDQAIDLAAQVLQDVRAGQAPEAAACAFDDAPAFLGEFFPGGTDDPAAGVPAGPAREPVAERVSVGPERVSAPEHADLCLHSAIGLAGMLRRREVSAREVIAAHIDRIEAFDPAINAIVTRTFDAARAQAAAADEAMARGEPAGLLHGLPVAHKDLLDTAGVRTTYGSPLFAGHVPEHDDLVVTRMAQAGAISLGKTNTPEFGAGSHTVNPVFGATRNPYDLGRSAGGSSGGAAAALAARLVCLADGSDLGGSLRNPASFCNVVGLRPSPGRVPRWPIADVDDQLGVTGPMARTVADAALLLAVQAGPDARVPLALDQPAPAVTDPAQVTELLTRDLRGLRVAWSPDIGLPVEPGVLEALAPARQVLAGLAGSVTDAAPDLSGADEAFRTFRAFRFATFYGELLAEHPDRVGANVAWNIRRGLELTVADLGRATRLRAALADRVSAFFAEVDVLACPVSAVAPFDVTLDWVHEINGAPQQTYLDWMASAYLISVTGLPAISVPAGFTAGGLPVGLQLVGRRRGDWDLLAVAHAFEAATGHSARLPGSAPPLAGPGRPEVPGA